MLDRNLVCSCRWWVHCGVDNRKFYPVNEVGPMMGIDAEIYVALKKGADIKEINKRFKEIHSAEDVVFKDTDNLIIGKSDCTYYNEHFEYTNTYEVNTYCARFYGEGYERGPCQQLVLQIEWLRAQPETVELYYFGDSGDPRVWTYMDSVDLMTHFWKVGHSPYADWAKATWKVKEEPIGEYGSPGSGEYF